MPEQIEQIEQINRGSIEFKRQAKLAALDVCARIAVAKGGNIKISDLSIPANTLYEWLIKDVTNKSKEQEEEEKAKTIEDAQ